MCMLTVPLYFEQVAEMCRDGRWIDVFARAGYLTHDKLLAVYWDQWHMSFVFLNRLLSLEGLLLYHYHSMSVEAWT